MDWLGVALFSSGLTPILLGVTYLSYGFTAVWEGIGFLLAGAALLLLFARVELTAVSPLVDFHLFKIRVLVAGNIAQTLYSACWAGLLLLFALFLEIVLGYTPLQAGIGVIPIEVAYLPSAILAGKISDKYRDEDSDKHGSCTWCRWIDHTFDIRGRNPIPVCCPSISSS